MTIVTEDGVRIDTSEIRHNSHGVSPFYFIGDYVDDRYACRLLCCTAGRNYVHLATFTGEVEDEVLRADETPRDNALGRAFFNGRNSAWNKARLEADRIKKAWKEGQDVYIVGQTKAGKTRGKSRKAKST